jgi:membrane protease YdiL (CAAX protease family)
LDDQSRTPKQTSGIWGDNPTVPEQRTPLNTNDVSATPQQPEADSPQRFRRKKAQWGLRHVIYSVVGFLGVQILASIGLIVYAFTQTDVASVITNPAATTDEITQATTSLLSAPLVLAAVQFSMYLTWLAFAWFATKFRGLNSFKKDFWLRFRWYDAPLGAVIAWGLIALETAIFSLLPMIFPGLNMEGTDNGSFLTQYTGVWFVIVAIGIGGIAGPFFEELYFRGFVMQGLIRYFRKGLRRKPTSKLGNKVYTDNPGLYNGYLKAKRWMYDKKYILAMIISSVAFGLMHWQGTETFGQMIVPVFTGLLGLLFAYVSIKMRRIGLAVFIHIFFNTTTLILSTFS